MPSNAQLFVSVLVFAAAACAAGSAHALIVSNAPTQNVTCVDGTCTAGQNAVLNVIQLQKVLNHGDTVVDASGQAVQIVAAVRVPAGRAFTIKALDLFVSAPVIVRPAGTVNLSVQAGPNDVVSQSFSRGGYLRFADPATSSLTIAGTPYILVASVTALAQGVAASPAGYFALATAYDAAKDGTYANAPVTNIFNGVFEGSAIPFRISRSRGTMAPLISACSRKCFIHRACPICAFRR